MLRQKARGRASTPMVDRAMRTLDDTALIQQFVDRQATLAANQNLRIEPAFDTVQLLSKRGGVLATMKPLDARPTITVRRNSDYVALIHSVLLDRGFVPIAATTQSEFEQYQSCELPPGYTVNYTDAKTLWKEWWQRTRHMHPNTIQLDLLIMARQTWYPIRDVVCSQGLLFFTTLVNEVTLTSTDRIAWLQRLPGKPPIDLDALLSPAKSTEDSSAFDLPTQPLTVSSPPSPIPSPTVSREGPPVATTALPRSTNRPDTEAARPDLRQVLKCRQGKLYITTSLGEIVVEGMNLKFWLDEADPAKARPQPIELSNYRDRDSRVAHG